MTSLRRVPAAALVLALLAPAAAWAQEETAEETPLALPPESDEVKGTCLTPRQAWLQHLWWAGREKDYARAAACFDTSRLADPREGPELAQRLLDYLDSEGREINTADRASASPDYIDPNSKRHEYRDPVAPEFVIVRQEDGRWLFSAESLQRIPDTPFARRIARYLPDLLHAELIGGIVAWQLVGILLLIFVALFFQKLTVFIVGTYFRHLLGKTQVRYLKRMVERADRPIGGLSMAAVFYLGFPELLFPLGISKVALVATRALAAFSLVWLGYRLIDVLGDWMQAKADKTETKLDDQLVPLVTKTLKVFVSVLGVIFVLQNLNVDVASLLAGVGLGGLAFALAAKDTVANFFGSVMIFVDKPFQIGDWIVIGGFEGTVAEVGFRTTRIRTFYDSMVTVPNAMITNIGVDNYGARAYRRYRTTLSLTYDTPPEKMQAFCEGVRAVIQGLPGMRKDFYFVEFHDWGESGLNVMLYCFMKVPNWPAELRTRTNLNLAILRLAKELGVSFAFPTRTLHLDSMVKPGESRPAWSGSTEPGTLGGVVRSFGPGGDKALPGGFAIAGGFDPAPRPEPPTGGES